MGPNDVLIARDGDQAAEFTRPGPSLAQDSCAKHDICAM